MTGSCLHLYATQMGRTEARVEQADASVAGLLMFTGVYSCPDCKSLVAGVTLRRRSGDMPVLTTGFVSLVPPRGVTPEGGTS